MIQLPHSCYCGEFTVTPSNWRQVGASVKKDWYISHRFYDPDRKEKYPKGLYRMIKGGINRYKDLAGRREAVETQIRIHLKILKEGYNPITDATKSPLEHIYEISPTTPFIDALNEAFNKIKTSKDNKACIKSCLKYITHAAEQLRFKMLEIQSISRKHIYLLLEQCEKNQAKWSDQNYNHYRAYLMALFKILRKLEAVKFNPVLEIEKIRVERKIKNTLSEAQRILIDEYLLNNDPNFRRYIHIFFHSGSRIAELSRLQGKDIDIDKQRFKITVRKGQIVRQEWRPIKNIALDFWVEAVKNCGLEDYVFSRGVKPWRAPVLPEYITKRWLKVIKKDKLKGGLGISIDFYSLKHLNLDETAEQISAMQDGIMAAADMAGHTTPVITLKYAQGERDRQNERLKKLGNKFA